MPGLYDVDGSLNFSGGVNSVKVTTVATERNPDGLRRNEQAWLVNATVRDGGISQRWAWKKRGRIHDGSALYQGGVMYDPTDGDPYPILSIGGHLYRVDVDTAIAVDLTAAFVTVPQFNPPTIDYAFFAQAFEFLVIQAGDGTTKPFFWDGTTLRRSLGINITAPGTPGVSEIPPAFAMDSFMNRLWFAQGRTYGAGDIAGGASGTAPFNFRDAVLNVTENPLVLNGDNFALPDNAQGNIRALKKGATIDAALGQGRLFIFTQKSVCALQVPVSRKDWIAAGNEPTGHVPMGMKTDNPLQTIVQLVNGSVNDRGVVAINGDLYYQSLEPAIRSLKQSVRFFNNPGNRSISGNMQRVLQFNDRSLLRFCSGIEFDNRLLETQLPRQTDQGVVSDAIAVRDFVPSNSEGEDDRPPTWEGIYQGVPIFQLLKGDFGGRDRAFAIARNEEDGGIDLWELTIGERFEKDDNRVQWAIEFPAFVGKGEFELKRLAGGELWYDRVFGKVEFTMQFRPDGVTCWQTWHQWNVCAPRNMAEICDDPVAYPTGPLGDQYVQTQTLPRPPNNCIYASGRPANEGYQFQCRLIIKGPARIRGLLLFLEPRERPTYTNMKQ